jgi:hypothetical protein
MKGYYYAAEQLELASTYRSGNAYAMHVTCIDCR